MTAHVIKGNKREVPPGVPVGAWRTRIEAYAAHPDLLRGLPFFDGSMEYLSPRRLLVVKAKAMVWLEMTGEWPSTIQHWWELRCSRRDGSLPPRTDMVQGAPTEDGGVKCGECGARYSDMAPRCKLCGVAILVERAIDDHS